MLDHNDDFIVVNKSPGITVQRDGQQPGLLELVARDLKLPHVYPVHRLDRETSGLVILARTKESNRELSGIFAQREIRKFYIALSNQKPRKKQGAIIGDMEKARRGSWKLSKSLDNPAITQMFSCSMAPGIRLFLLRPKTGKTHQLRVALKSIGAPILGDERYGADASDRMYLHAWQLQFEWRGRALRYEALPEPGELFTRPEFESALAAYRQPETLDWPKR